VNEQLEEASVFRQIARARRCTDFRNVTQLMSVRARSTSKSYFRELLRGAWVQSMLLIPVWRDRVSCKAPV